MPPKQVRSALAALAFAAPALAAAGLAAPSGALSAEAPPRAVTVAHAFYWAGFPVAESETRLRLGPGDYEVRATARSVGLVGVLFDMELASLATGTVAGGAGGAALRPSGYASDSTFNGDPRSIRLAYLEDGTVAAEIVPSAEEEDRGRVPAALTLDTLDPLSALLAMGAAPRADGIPCADTVAVFDGRRRYDLRLERVGTEHVEPGFTAYEGPALRCRVHLDRVAGFQRDYLEQEPEPPPPITLWLAEAVPGLYLPVRFEAQSFLGPVRGGIARIEVD